MCGLIKDNYILSLFPVNLLSQVYCTFECMGDGKDMEYLRNMKIILAHRHLTGFETGVIATSKSKALPRKKYPFIIIEILVSVG